MEGLGVIFCYRLFGPTRKGNAVSFKERNVLLLGKWYLKTAMLLAIARSTALISATLVLCGDALPYGYDPDFFVFVYLGGILVVGETLRSGTYSQTAVVVYAVLEALLVCLFPPLFTGFLALALGHFDIASVIELVTAEVEWSFGLTLYISLSTLFWLGILVALHRPLSRADIE
jgi:hypothetical protein